MEPHQCPRAHHDSFALDVAVRQFTRAYRVKISPIAKFGRDWIIRTGFEKGLGFLGAGQLLEPYCAGEPIRHVRLHLMCQGLELILKSALLAKDFGTYRPQLANPKRFGHDLIKIAEAVEGEYGLSTMRPGLRTELEELARLYSAHHLRYPGICDIFIDPNAIGVRHVNRRVKALVRLMNLEFSRTNFGRP